MTVSEANAFNTICRYLGLSASEGRLAISDDDAVRAFAFLAERSSKTLMAGVSGGNIVARRARVAKLGGFR